MKKKYFNNKNFLKKWWKFFKKIYWLKQNHIHIISKKISNNSIISNNTNESHLTYDNNNDSHKSINNSNKSMNIKNLTKKNDQNLINKKFFIEK